MSHTQVGVRFQHAAASYVAFRARCTAGESSPASNNRTGRAVDQQANTPFLSHSEMMQNSPVSLQNNLGFQPVNKLQVPSLRHFFCLPHFTESVR